MSDVQNERAESIGGEYPPILDEVTDEQLVFVQDIVRKSRSLEAGPVADRHNTWKKETLVDVLMDVPEALLFANLGAFIASAVEVLNKGTAQLGGQLSLAGAIMAAVSMLASGKLVIDRRFKKEDSPDAQGDS